MVLRRPRTRLEETDAPRTEARRPAGRSEGEAGSPGAVQAERAHRWAWGSRVGQRGCSGEPRPAWDSGEHAGGLLAAGSLSLPSWPCWGEASPLSTATASAPGRGHPRRYDRLGARTPLDQGWVRVLATKPWDGHCSHRPQGTTLNQAHSAPTPGPRLSGRWQWSPGRGREKEAGVPGRRESRRPRARPDEARGRPAWNRAGATALWHTLSSRWTSHAKHNVKDKTVQSLKMVTLEH